MQDHRAIPGLARRVLGAAASGGGGGGAGVLRGYSPPSAGKQIGPIKCPRCDSTNTKFCYYNNYNLAQPRHFCKSCRRYWTKGGVLRNVPVGGGCRKSKHSSSKPSGGGARKDSHICPAAAANRSDSDSGRDNSNLAETEASTSAPFPDSSLMATYPDRNPETAPCFGPSMPIEDPLAQAAEILPDTLTASGGSFTHLLPQAVTHPMVDFRSFSDTRAIQHPFPAQSIAGEDRIGFQSDSTNPTVAIDPSAARAAGLWIAGMEWPTSVDPTLLDLPVAYWNQGHWGDADPALYLP